MKWWSQKKKEQNFIFSFPKVKACWKSKIDITYINIYNINKLYIYVTSYISCKEKNIHENHVHSIALKNKY